MAITACACGYEGNRLAGEVAGEDCSTRLDQARYSRTAANLLTN
jgi:hypothetical protein